MQKEEKTGIAQPICNRDCLNCIYDDCINESTSDLENLDAYLLDPRTLAKKEEQKKKGRIRYHELKKDPVKYENLKRTAKEWRDQNKERLKQYYHNYYLDHKEYYQNYAKKYYAEMKERYQTDPEYRAKLTQQRREKYKRRKARAMERKKNEKKSDLQYGLLPLPTSGLHQ